MLVVAPSDVTAFSKTAGVLDVTLPSMTTVARQMQFTAKPGEGEALAAELLAAAKALQGTAGCEQYLVSRGADAPDRVYVDERWRSQEALDAALPAKDDPAVAKVLALLDPETPPQRTELIPLGGVGMLDAPKSGYTHRNLLAIEDMAPKFGLAAMGESRFPREDLELEQLGLGHYRIPANVRQPFGHRHGEAEELYLVVSGSGRVRIEDETVELKAYDLVRVGPELTRCFEAGADGLELLAVGARHPGDGEVLQGWWQD